MNTLGNKSSILDDLFEENKEIKKNEEKKQINIELPSWIYQTSDSIVEAIELEDKKALKAIFLLKHPETGIEPSEYELKQYLCDLPYINMAVFNLYLKVKQERESVSDLLETTTLKLNSIYEEKIKKQWFEEKEKKLRTTIGVISKNQIEMEMAKDSQAMKSLDVLKNNLRELHFKEEMLQKMYKLLDLRSYEIQTLLKVEMGLNR